VTTGPDTEVVAGVSVSHSTAAIEQIETVAARSTRAAVESLLESPDVLEAFVLQTCNRAEAYVVSESAETAHEALSAYLGDVDRDSVRELDHEGSLRHLMSVACGLESLVLGEDQIMGQLREAYEDARGVGAIGPTLDDAILKALHVGERARNETAINEGAVSLGSAAVRFADAKHGVEDATILVVGAGEIATLTAKALDRTADRLVIANRTLPHAEHLAEELDTEASAVGLDAVPVAAAESDIAISATGSPDHVVDSHDLETAGEICIVDIAQPRDVAPDADSLDNVSVYDLDAIETITDETRRNRRDAAEAVESMIDAELEHPPEPEYKRKRADQVVAGDVRGCRTDQKPGAQDRPLEARTRNGGRRLRGRTGDPRVDGRRLGRTTPFGADPEYPRCSRKRRLVDDQHGVGAFRPWAGARAGRPADDPRGPGRHV